MAIRETWVGGEHQPSRFNITGVTMIAGLLEPKRLELLRELVPSATIVRIFVNPNNGGVLQDIPTVAAAADKLGLELQVVQAGTESEIDAVFRTLAQRARTSTHDRK